MSGPSTELELQVLQALEFPRSVGDILFLQPALKAAGSEPVEAAMASLSSAGLVPRVEGKKLWSMTEKGVRWLSESAEWQVRCDRINAVADDCFSVGGLVERGLVKVGDWWHDGRGATGSVVEVESWDAASNAVSIRVDRANPLELPLVLRRWQPMAGGEPRRVHGPTVWMKTSKTAASGLGLNSEQRNRVRAVATERLVGGFNSEGAVSLAADLLAGGIEDPAVVALAILPSDPNLLRRDDVEPMFDELCSALGVRLVVPGETGWVRARSLATAIVDGDLAPGVGASHLWPLWEDCGLVPGSDPLDMLQLFEEWERSVGAQRQEAERRIVASARSVVRDADRALAAMQMPNGFMKGTIRAVDVMPLLLEACPSFLPVWYEIEGEHCDAQNQGGRLYYLDAGDFARHVVEMHRSNHRRWIQNAFDIIERMHVEGDAYVRELATIGYLEDIGNIAGHAGLDPAVFEEYRGPESQRCWEGLEPFRSGQLRTDTSTDRRKPLRRWLRSKLPSQVANRSRSERQSRSPE